MVIFKSLKQKLFVSYLAGTSLIVIVTLIGFVQINNVLDDYLTVNKQYISTKYEVAQIHIDLTLGVQEWKNVLLRGHKLEERNKYWLAVKQVHETIDKSVSHLF